MLAMNTCHPMHLVTVADASCNCFFLLLLLSQRELLSRDRISRKLLVPRHLSQTLLNRCDS